MKEEEGMKDEETGMHGRGKDERGMHGGDKDVSATAGSYLLLVSVALSLPQQLPVCLPGTLCCLCGWPGLL